MSATETAPSAHEIIAKLLAGTGDLPVLPAVALKVMHELQAPGITVPRLVKLVEFDPALSAAVLRAANSALYGGVSNITNLTGAITRIGMKQTRNLIYALVLRSQVADAKAYGTFGPAVFEHSLAVAFGARLVADVARVAADDVFLCGLLHDLGKLALVKALRLHAGVPVEELPPTQLALIEEHHADAGALLTRSWGLPEAVALAIRHHHEPEAPTAPQPTTACVTLANALCHKLGLGGQSSPQVALETDRAVRALKLAPNDFATLVERLPAQVESASAALRPSR